MKPLDEAANFTELSQMVKQRRELIDMFRKGAHEELAAKEEKELKLIEGYMPAPRRTKRSMPRSPLPSRRQA